VPCYDWLEANGVDEWLPDRPMVVVDYTTRTLSYQAFVWQSDRRGWNPSDMLIVGAGANRTVAQHWRTVRLKVEPSAEVIDGFAASGGSLVECGKPDPRRDVRKRMHLAYQRRRR